METVYDWVTMGIFGALVTLFLHRSAMDEPPDTIWDYMPPSIGCAIANYAGNEGYPLIAIAIIGLIGIYIVKVLKFRPFGS